MKTKRKYHRIFGRGELTKKVLLSIGAGVAISSLFVAPGLAAAFHHFDRAAKRHRRQEEQIRKKRVGELLQNLKKYRTVDFYERGGEEFIELTEAGKKRVLKYKLDEIQLQKPKRWDKKWRIIIFDIPEKHKKAREALRRKLKELGFFPLQKSVFVSPYPCLDEVDFISEIFEVGRFVNYFEAVSFDDLPKLQLAFPELEK